MKEEGMGLNGWLDPNGIFYECKYGEHHVLASHLQTTGDALQDKNWININSTRHPTGVTEGIVGITAKPTTKQIKWINENMENFDTHQINDINIAKGLNYF
ncbi:hypothetical protein V7152_13225 [Neobacillus drentensis]|uniref:hypothetical protein n=1 Tax=Neobacillus drentensis TaxID=220684 RepID=UPI002FFF9EDA